MNWTTTNNGWEISFNYLDKIKFNPSDSNLWSITYARDDAIKCEKNKEYSHDDDENFEFSETDIDILKELYSKNQTKDEN